MEIFEKSSIIQYINNATTGAHTMNKQETREAAKIIQYGQHLGAAYMARGLSALYRSARTTKSQNAILALGMAYGLVSQAEWIV